jgi:ribosomal protein S18 acetylase RimI-like enzyme
LKNSYAFSISSDVIFHIGNGMQMKIERNGIIRPGEINSIRRAINWVVQDEEKLEKAFSLSWGWITARNEKDELIGFTRILSDGMRHAYILDVIVHPSYQNKGIGTALMTEVMNILRENRLVPTLVSVPGKEEFYRKFGFKEQDEGMTAMCIRKPFWEDQNQ